MATNLAIDIELLVEAQRVLGFKTKRETVNLALKEIIAARKRKGFLDLIGTMDWDETYDYKTERSRDHKVEGQFD